MRARVASILPLGLLALALGLSACGSSSVKSTIDPVAVAAEKTVATKTARFSMTMTERVSALPSPMVMTAEGAENFVTRQASMSMDLSALAAAAGGRLGSASDWKVEAVGDGLVTYMRAPFLQAMLNVDKPWLKIDLEEAGKMAGFNVASLTSYGPNQSNLYLDYLLGAKDTKVLGHELVRGVRTTHYETTVDFDLYLRSLPSDRRADAKKMLDSLNKATNAKYGPFEIWIDAQNRVRREKISSFSDSTPAGKVQMDITIDLFDYDLPVSITIPPADQTVDLVDLAGSLGSS